MRRAPMPIFLVERSSIGSSPKEPFRISLFPGDRWHVLDVLLGRYGQNIRVKICLGQREQGSEGARLRVPVGEYTVQGDYIWVIANIHLSRVVRDKGLSGKCGRGNVRYIGRTTVMSRCTTQQRGRRASTVPSAQSRIDLVMSVDPCQLATSNPVTAP